MPKKTWGQPKTQKKYRRYKKQIVPRNIVKDNVVFIKRQYLAATFGRTVGGGWGANPITFTANSLPSWSEFQSLFDSYRICAIKCTFTPWWDGNDLSNQGTANGVWTTVLPRVYTLVDRNGITAGSLATENQFIESAKAVLIQKPQEPFSIYIKNPGVESAVSIGGGFTANAEEKTSPWLDTSNGGVEHFGAAIGMVLPGGSAADIGFFYNINVTFYMQFKNAV